MGMARGPLMPSPRLMPMPTTTELTVLATAMELTDMLVLAMLDMLADMPMVPTPMPMVLMPTASKMSSQTQIIIAHQVQTEAQKQTKSRSNLTFSAINSFVIWVGIGQELENKI